MAANKLSKLANFLVLTKNYYRKYGVTLSHEKIKLLRISIKEQTELDACNPISIDNHTIDSVKKLNMSGPSGHWINVHRKVLAATLSSGIAQKSRATPAVPGYGFTRFAISV